MENLILYQRAYWYHTSRLSIFHMIFHVNVLLTKLPNTSTRGLLPMQQTIVDYYLVDLVVKYSDDNIMIRNLRGRQTGRIRM